MGSNPLDCCCLSCPLPGRCGFNCAQWKLWNWPNRKIGTSQINTNMTGAKLIAGCKESTVTSDSPNHLQLDELEPYTEYKVVVAAHLGSLNISKEEEVVGRTGPLQHVSWSVGLDGLLTVVWRERVADFRGKDPVQVRQAFSSRRSVDIWICFS